MLAKEAVNASFESSLTEGIRYTSFSNKYPFQFLFYKNILIIIVIIYQYFHCFFWFRLERKFFESTFATEDQKEGMGGEFSYKLYFVLFFHN
jgi:hypothetical protein